MQLFIAVFIYSEWCSDFCAQRLNATEDKSVSSGLCAPQSCQALVAWPTLSASILFSSNIGLVKKKHVRCLATERDKGINTRNRFNQQQNVTKHRRRRPPLHFKCT